MRLQGALRARHDPKLPSQATLADRRRWSLPTLARQSFLPPLSPWLRIALASLVTIYVAQLLLDNWLGFPVGTLGGLWAPLGPSGPNGMFHIWQPATALLLNGDPGSAFLDWLMVWFFLPPTLEALGRRGAAKLLGTAWLAGVLVGFALAWPGIVLPGTPCLGLTALTTAMVVVFGLARPTAQILIFFVLPIRAIWIVWVELFLLGLYFLAYRNLESAVSLAACGTAWLWMWCDGSPSVALLKIRRRWLSRARPTSARGRFGVIQGGRADPPGGGWVH